MIIVDCPKEETLGVFKSKAGEAGCHLRHTEPESPYQMSAEGGISELKGGQEERRPK